jgi:ATP-dependent exoDNAse (exonuclease V) alpha subunit
MIVVAETNKEVLAMATIIMIKTAGQTETVVDLAMDLITGQETLMDLVIIMVREITTDQDLTMVQDQATDHQKEAVLVLLNLNSFKIAIKKNSPHDKGCFFYCYTTSLHT